MSTENENKEFDKCKELAIKYNEVILNVANNVNFILKAIAKGEAHKANERLGYLDQDYQELAVLFGDISELLTGKFEYHYFTNTKDELEEDGWDVD